MGGGVAGQPAGQEQGVHALDQLLQPVKVCQRTGLHIPLPFCALAQPPNVVLHQGNSLGIWPAEQMGAHPYVRHQG